jgi:hypothetical protein
MRLRVRVITETLACVSVGSEDGEPVARFDDLK